MQWSAGAVVLALVLASLEASADESTNPCRESKAVADVIDVQGVCYRRAKSEAQRQPIAPRQALLEADILECDAGGRLKLRFCASRAEKEIAYNAPQRYIVPNVPRVRGDDGTDPALRRASADDAPVKVTKLRAQNVSLYNRPNGSKIRMFSRDAFTQPWPVLNAGDDTGFLEVQVEDQRYWVKSNAVQTSVRMADDGAAPRDSRTATTR